jgi:hypothetical protein
MGIFAPKGNRKFQVSVMAVATKLRTLLYHPKRMGSGENLRATCAGGLGAKFGPQKEVGGAGVGP